MIDFGKKSTPAREMRSTNNLHTALESDRGRIINSAAIRRLQQKTPSISTRAQCRSAFTADSLA